MRIPLLTPTDVPNAWHQVIAPGGYEWWHFDAEEPAGELRVVADFFLGRVFDAEYLRLYRRYRRRPTRCAPPLPAGYPSVAVAVYRRDKIVSQSTSSFLPEQFTAATDRLDIHIGPNAVRSAPDGSFQLDVHDARVSIALKFVPCFKPADASAALRSSNFFPEQKWSVTEPLCNVAGDVTLESGRSSFTGRGFHDYHFGTTPLGPDFKSWMRGRVLMNDHSVIFHSAELTTGASELHLLEADALGFRQIPVDRARLDHGHLQAGPLILSSPTVMAKSHSGVHLTYQASLRGASAQGFFESWVSHRGLSAGAVTIRT
jgi:hypothetical protein